ncbi:MAG: hypothetical protein LKG20_11920 [Tetrasphaera jenkinsii]|jgi:hypothetical protein|nr:hypothetical protein [Tetrasphaera jenkinsii]
MLSSLVRMPRRRRLITASALAVVMMAGGCSSGESSAPGGGTSSANAAGSTEATGAAVESPSKSAGGTTTGGTGAPAADVTGTPLPILASRTGQSDTTPVTVSLNEVRAAGKLMTVTWSVRNDGQEPWRVGDFFSGRYAHGWTDQLGSELSGVASGIYVLDAVSARRYLPAQDKDGNCVCTSNTAAIEVVPGASTVLQAVFQAPPPEVAKVQVVLPNIGPFDAVPVAR